MINWKTVKPGEIPELLAMLNYEHVAGESLLFIGIAEMEVVELGYGWGVNSNSVSVPWRAEQSHPTRKAFLRGAFGFEEGDPAQT